MSKLKGGVSMKVLIVVMMCVCTILAGCKQKKEDTWPEVELSMGFMTIKACDLPPECREDFADVEEEFGAGPDEKIEVILVDLNQDGIDEWIVEKGVAFAGSGGMTYAVFSKAAVALPFKPVGALFLDHHIILSPVNGWFRLAIEGRGGGGGRYLTEFIWRDGAYHGKTVKVNFRPDAAGVDSSE